jgi:archaellum component FlaF (FlaF/FlaG flagellin family)
MLNKMKTKCDWLMVGVFLLVAVYLYVEYINSNCEAMDARYFKYIDEKAENTPSTEPVLYGATSAPDAPVTATKCGNFVSSDLLPKTTAVVKDPTFTFAPNKDVKLLIKPAQSVIGVNTQGGSLRNANLDLRSAPAIDKKEVSPWLNSTIDADLYRRPLE